MPNIKLVLSLIVLAIIFGFGFIIATGHIRSDNVTGTLGDGFNQRWYFCVGGNQTAHYLANRYVTFPGSSTSSYQIISNSYFEAEPPFLNCNQLNNQTYIEVPEEVYNLTNLTTVCLWSTNPSPTVDCVDTTPPVISNLTAGSITQTGATITWTTNETATHTIKYGTTSGSYDSYPNTKTAGSGTSASGAL